MQDISSYWNDLVTFVNNPDNAAIVKFGLTIIYAIIVLIIGFFIIGRIVRLMDKFFARRNFDPTITTFFNSLISASLKIVLLVIVVGMLGVETSSIVALLAGAGFAVGLALQGSLSNFAGGVLIVFFKPYKVGDYIEAQGHAGTVKSIQIFNTILKTPDNKTIIIPNGALSNTSVINYSTEKTRRVEFIVGIGYEDDFEKAKEIIKGIIDNDKRILSDPAPFVRVTNLGASSVDITTRVWAQRSDVYNVLLDLTENTKKEFDKNKISIPFPQTDVHLYKHDS